ncbi:hypothetical protein O6H91_Y567600 [Diphasiastrum complanatum]|nr:hypothetical protein O6H91_Y567600 [Diphasiastrum complanatum]
MGGLQACKTEASVYTIPSRTNGVTDTILYVEKATKNGKSSIENSSQQSKPDDASLDSRIPTEELEDENACSGQNGCSFKGRSIDRRVSDHGLCGCGQRFGDNGGFQEGLLERLMDKLFSERGKGFASAVVGCVARDLVLEVMKRCKKVENKRDFTTEGSEWELRSLAPDVCEIQQECDEKQYVLHLENSCGNKRNSDKYLPKEGSGSGISILESFLDFASESRGKSLIAECIEAFVATAVSVYLVKTKDVNVYEELVAGLTKPSHQAPVKELLRSVCSGAMETLVRTSHEVLSQGLGHRNNGPDLRQNEHRMQDENFPENPEKGTLESDKSNVGTEEDSQMRRCGSDTCVHKTDDSKSITLLNENLDSLLKSQRALGSIPLSTCNGSDSSEKEDSEGRCLVGSHQDSRITVTRRRNNLNGGPLNLIDGLSKALAVPNNRKLVIEVAGAMTSEAVRSFFDVIWTIFKPVHGGQTENQQQAGTLSWQVPYPCLEKIRHITKSIAANSLVVVTLWLAIVMHVTSGLLKNPSYP